MVSLSSLPVELLPRIVELVWLQDEAFKGIGRPIPRSSLEHSRRTTAAIEDGGAYGAGIGALFRTNKAFSALAAPHLFSEISVRKLSKIEWKLFICYRYGKYVRSLDMRSTSYSVKSELQAHVDDFFLSLPQLSQLQKLTLSREAAFLWAPYDPVNDFTPNAQRRQILTTFAPRLRELTLHEVPLLELQHIIEICTQLHALSLRECNLGEPVAFIGMLVHTVHLQTLALSLCFFEDDAGLYRQLQTAGVALPKVKNFTYSIRPYELEEPESLTPADALQLCQGFREHLESISLDCSCESDDSINYEWASKVQSGWEMEFPSLRRLTLIGDDLETIPILALFLKAPLEHIKLAMMEGPVRVPPDFPILRPLLQTLRRITIFADHNPSEEDKWWRDAIFALERSAPHIILKDECPTGYQVSQERAEEGSPLHDELLSSAGHVRDRLSSALDRLKTLRDETALRRLHTNLGPLVGWLDLEKD